MYPYRNPDLLLMKSPIIVFFDKYVFFESRIDGVCQLFYLYLLMGIGMA